MINLTTFPSFSGNLLDASQANVPSPPPTSFLTGPDLIPISLADESHMSKSKAPIISSVPTPPTKTDNTLPTGGLDGDEAHSSPSKPSRTSSWRKKQTLFFGIPIHYSVNTFSSPPAQPQSSSPHVGTPDKRVCLVEDRHAEKKSRCRVTSLGSNCPILRKANRKSLPTSLSHLQITLYVELRNKQNSGQYHITSTYVSNY